MPGGGPFIPNTLTITLTVVNEVVTAVTTTRVRPQRFIGTGHLTIVGVKGALVNIYRGGGWWVVVGGGSCGPRSNCSTHTYTITGEYQNIRAQK